MSKLTKTLSLTVFIILLDQVIKVWIKTNFTLGEEIRIFDWFIIHFTENNGMAFGWEFGGILGKIALSLFRIVAVSFLMWYVIRLSKENAPVGYIASIGMIMAGALGNIIDSAFYGVLFSESNFYNAATFLPESGGYAPFLQGKVVDMLYFPLVRGTFPEWLPMWGGDSFLFFRPVFNIADSSITIGVFLILLFYRNYLREQKLIP
ncbi:MAG: lipoprotein signal peptidase [Okeania sp. SIO3C4]|nr:lipoprotein signal peptidase [Okeania sp. SIO3C4]